MAARKPAGSTAKKATTTKAPAAPVELTDEQKAAKVEADKAQREIDRKAREADAATWQAAADGGTLAQLVDTALASMIQAVTEFEATLPAPQAAAAALTKFTDKKEGSLKRFFVWLRKHGAFVTSDKEAVTPEFKNIESLGSKVVDSFAATMLSAKELRAAINTIRFQMMHSANTYVALLADQREQELREKQQQPTPQAEDAA